MSHRARTHTKLSEKALATLKNLHYCLCMMYMYMYKHYIHVHTEWKSLLQVKQIKKRWKKPNASGITVYCWNRTKY